MEIYSNVDFVVTFYESPTPTQRNQSKLKKKIAVNETICVDVVSILDTD